jgi:hypothetical protein
MPALADPTGGDDFAEQCGRWRRDDDRQGVADLAGLPSKTTIRSQGAAAELEVGRRRLARGNM